MENNNINIDNFSSNLSLKPSEIDTAYKRPRSVILIFIYYLSTLVISLFIGIGLLSIDEIFKVIFDKEIDYLIIDSLLTTLTYIFTLLFLMPFSIRILKSDFKIAFKKPFKILLFSFVFFLGFTVLNDLYYTYVEPNIINLFVKLNILDSNIVNSNVTSGNQQSIESMLNLKTSAIIIIPSIVLIGPFIEELIFRKAIFRLLNFKNNLLNILISGLIFALIHVLSTIVTYLLLILNGSEGYYIQYIILELIFLWGYFLCGVLLGAIYTLTGQNITIVFIVHLLNNLLVMLNIYLK